MTKKKKSKEEVFHLSFKKVKYKKTKITTFKYAWKHPIVSCRLSIKYFWKWLHAVNSPALFAVPRYYVFFLSVVVRVFAWIYLGFVINVFTNGVDDGIRLLTEIPMAAGMSFLGIFLLLMIIRFVIAFLEMIRVVKEDNSLLYGVGVFIVYASGALIAAGTAIQ